jgi:hypothetical protein
MLDDTPDIGLSESSKEVLIEENLENTSAGGNHSWWIVFVFF